MNRKILLIAAVSALLAAGAAAARSPDIGALAEQSGLTERQVRMVLGAPVAFAEYRSSYRDSRDRLRRAVGGRDALSRLAAEYRAAQDALAQN